MKAARWPPAVRAATSRVSWCRPPPASPSPFTASGHHLMFQCRGGTNGGHKNVVKYPITTNAAKPSCSGTQTQLLRNEGAPLCGKLFAIKQSKRELVSFFFAFSKTLFYHRDLLVIHVLGVV